MIKNKRSMPSSDDRDVCRNRGQRDRRTGPVKNASWSPGRKGQGGEGYSKGYGGSVGSGTGPSGSEDNHHE